MFSSSLCSSFTVDRGVTKWETHARINDKFFRIKKTTWDLPAEPPAFAFDYRWRRSWQKGYSQWTNGLCLSCLSIKRASARHRVPSSIPIHKINSMKREAKIYPISRRRYWKKSDSTIDPLPPPSPSCPACGIYRRYRNASHGNSRIGDCFFTRWIARLHRVSAKCKSIFIKGEKTSSFR